VRRSILNGNIDNYMNKIESLPKGKLFSDAKNIESIFQKSQYTWSETIEAFEKNKKNSNKESVNIKDIYITQPNIQTGKLKNIIANISKTPDINVVEFSNGEKVIFDGHHRLVANWAIGNKKIKVNLAKVSKIKESRSTKLKDLIKEIEDDQIDISDLKDIDDEIKKELKAGSKNEVLGAIMIGLTAVKIINVATSIIEKIAKKNNVDLKNTDEKWYTILKNITGKIDSYVVKPVELVLTPFIKDPDKRKSVAKTIAAVTLTIASMYLSIVDLKKIESITTVIEKLAPDIGKSLAKTIISKNKENITTLLNKYFKS
jgi:hypothetical protein